MILFVPIIFKNLNPYQLYDITIYYTGEKKCMSRGKKEKHNFLFFYITKNFTLQMKS